ncbi:hypothetical protein Tco_0648331 [Tanacetum coccineum]
MKSTLVDIDKSIDAGYANSDLLNNRTNVMTSLLDLEKLKSLEVAQKAKIKWSIEGNENSKFFHDEFLSHFKNRFDCPSLTRLSLDMNFPNQISLEIQVDLEKDVSLEELKRAVWDCGMDKSPGPDGFTFGFYQRYWRLLEKDAIEAVSYFFQHGSFPKGVNSSFIALIPKTQNANMVKDFRPISMFKGVSIGSNLHLSHLFYDDDVVFLGQCKLMGIAVDDDIVNQVAYLIGCLQLKPPFSYLGSRIGGSMSRINSWDDIVNKLLARLSKWKMKTLSLGGRLTLLKTVLGSTPIYYMSLFKVSSQVLKKMESILSRFFNGVDIMEKKLSLAKFILAMHGKDGNLGTTVKSSFPSIWLDIIRDLHNLKNKCIDLLGLIKKKIGNGVYTLFWEDTWKGDIAFKFLYPRIYKLETCKQINVNSKLAHDNMSLTLRRMPRGSAELEQFNDMINSLTDLQLPNMQDRWFWSLSGSGDFSVASDIFRKIASWWDVNHPRVSSFEEWEMWISSLTLSSRRKQLFEGIIYIGWWSIWNFRNQVVFGSTIPSKAFLFDDIVARSFQ